MTSKDDMNIALDKATEEWDAHNERSVDSRAAQFFFFAGCQYGAETTTKIHNDIYHEPVEGHAV